MFKAGDKVICINEYEILDIFLNEEYTVEYYSEKDKMMALIETQYLYDVDDENCYFMSITEIRKQKLEKLCLKQETEQSV
jgi:glycogen synthase